MRRIWHGRHTSACEIRPIRPGLLGCSLAAAAIGIAAAAVSLYILSGSSTFVGAQAFSDWSIHDIALLAAMVLGAIVAVCALFMASYAIGKRIGWAREEREAKTRNAACPASGLDSRKKEF